MRSGLWEALALACIFYASLWSAPETGAVYPGKRWEFRNPAEAGMDARFLEEFSGFAGGRGCVVRHGYMVYTWGDQSRPADVASAVKPWYTHFLLKAVEEGRIGGLDEEVRVFEPGLDSLNRSLGFKERGITWRHLANQVSCYGVTERPGKAYDYSDFNMALFFDILFLKVYRSSWAGVDREVLHPLLTDVLGCEDPTSFMAFGPGDRPGRLAVSVRDFARFGLLYLRQGNWRGRQLVSASHACLATATPLPASFPRTAGKPSEMLAGQRTIGGGNNQCDHLGAYSFAWWINGLDSGGRRLWPDVPSEAFGAFGHGGPRAMAVIPSLDMVVSWNDAELNGWDRVGKALKLLVQAVRDNPNSKLK